MPCSPPRHGLAATASVMVNCALGLSCQHQWEARTGLSRSLPAPALKLSLVSASTSCQLLPGTHSCSLCFCGCFLPLGVCTSQGSETPWSSHRGPCAQVSWGHAVCGHLGCSLCPLWCHHSLGTHRSPFQAHMATGLQSACGGWALTSPGEQPQSPPPPSPTACETHFLCVFRQSKAKPSPLQRTSWSCCHSLVPQTPGLCFPGSWGRPSTWEREGCRCSQGAGGDSKNERKGTGKWLQCVRFHACGPDLRHGLPGAVTARMLGQDTEAPPLLSQQTERLSEAPAS